MSHDSHSTPALFTQVDITAGAQLNHAGPTGWERTSRSACCAISWRLKTGRTSCSRSWSISSAPRSGSAMPSLGQWKQANPELARNCRMAAEALSQVQVEFLNTMTHEINDNSDALMDGEFMLNEFVDRFGPRLAHLNGVLQVLAQLSTASNPTTS